MGSQRPEIQTVHKFQPINTRYFPDLQFFIEKWLITNMLKHTMSTNNNGIRFYKQIYNEYYYTRTAKVMDTKNCHQNHIKNAKTTNFLLQSAFYTSKGRTRKVSFYDFWFKSYELTFYTFNHQNCFRDSEPLKWSDGKVPI